MSAPVYDADAWLTPAEKDALTTVITASRGNRAPTPDDCNRCGGLMCDQCSGPTDEYVPEYVRHSIKRWKPTHVDD